MSLRWARGGTLGVWALVLLSSALPAIQVFTVGALAESLNDGGTIGVLVAIVVLGLCVGASRALTDATLSTGQVVTRRLEAMYEARLADALAQRKPHDLQNPDLNAQMREARDAIARHVAPHADAAVSTLKAVLTAALLFVSLAGISAWAALLIVCSLIPTLIAFSVVSRSESTVWPTLAQHKARACYYSDQLVYDRTGIDLALLGSGPVVASESRRHFTSHAGLFRTMMTRSGLIIGASGLTTAAFAIGAIAIIAFGTDTGVAGVMAGVVAVLAGLGATADAGFCAGMVMSGSRSVLRYIEATAAADSPDPVQMRSEPVGCVEVKDLTVRYPSGIVGCRDIHLRAKRGQIVALVGVNGAGKSTIVSAISGLIEPAHGTVTFDGRTPDAREVCGVLSQDFGRYELSVRQAIALGRPDGHASDEQIWSALEFAQADGFVAALPDGLDTQLGQQWDGPGLSGGQWQRLALARIALRDAPVWILDEPTSAVDAEAEERIIDRLRVDADRRATILVTHRASTLRSVDHILLIDDGRVAEQGTFTELLAMRARFAELFARQTDFGGPDVTAPDTK